MLICAYNEEENIQALLRSLIAQKKEEYTLEKILIITDGCTDRTVEEINAVDHPQIERIVNQERKGLAYRLNQAYEINTSDILIKIDADTMPANDMIIAHVVKKFSDARVGLVAGWRVAAKGRTIIEKIHNIGDSIWHDTKKDIRGGNSIHNSMGTIQALRKDVARMIAFPSGLYSIDNYIYFSILQGGSTFSFAPDAIVFYKNPDTVTDYFKQHTRFLSAKHQLTQYFGACIYQEYRVPKGNMRKAITSHFLRAPFLTAGYLCIEILVRLHMKMYGYRHSKFGWEPTGSTKTRLHI